MRRRHRTFRALQSRPTDRDHCYFIRQGARWLERILAGFPQVDEETTTMLEDVLGEQAPVVAERLVRQVLGNFTQPAGDDDGTLNDDGPVAAALAQIQREGSPHAHVDVVAVLRRALLSRHRDLAYPGRSDSERGLTTLRRLFRLDRLEAELCALIYMAENYRPANEYFIGHLRCDEVLGRKYVCCALGVDRERLARAITHLARLEVLSVGVSSLSLDRDIDDLLSQGSAVYFRRKQFQPLGRSRSAPSAAHMPAAARDHICRLLESQPDHPVHVLLYGPPGTGKTTFARALLSGLDGPAFEILRDEDNSAKRRRSAIRVCLNCENGGKGAVLLVDEADGVLNTEWGWLFRGETHDKGWLNELLDEPGIRMVWIANDVRGIDPSVMRRFTFSHYFAPFTRKQRAEVWDTVARRHRVKRYLPAAEIDSLAGRYEVSAGVIDQAVRAATRSGAGGAEVFLHTVRLGIESHEQLRNGGRKRIRKGGTDGHFSLDGLNLDTDPAELVAQVRAFERVAAAGEHRVTLNLLFSGPPGTGKSELAKHIAHATDRPLSLRRISDVLGPYVGETEQNLARMFDEAERDQAVLVLDEVDTLLADRAGAHRSWEVSQVNEFLTQMETFRSVLICTTNRYDGLDGAALRRFTRKVGFDYLTPQGKVVFYGRLLAPLTTRSRLDEKEEQRLRALSPLAPGDFRVVRDRAALAAGGPPLTPEALVTALAEEIAARNRHAGAVSGVVGFRG